MMQALLSGAAIGSLYVLMSIGFALSLEIADIVNAAHGAFVVAGMYVTATLAGDGWPLASAIAASAVLMGLAAVPMYTLLMRSARLERGHRIQLVYTLMVFSMATAMFQIIFGADLVILDYESGSVEVFGGFLTMAQISAIAVAIVVSLALYWASRKTMLGKVAYVASLYPLGARSVGVPVDRIYLAVFTLGGTLAGLAGGILVTFQPVEPSLGLQYAVVVFLVALVSRTHLIGCLVLGFTYGIVQSVLGYLLDPALAGALTLCVFLIAMVGGRAGEFVKALALNMRPSNPAKTVEAL